jgi:hypothetical protein
MREINDMKGLEFITFCKSIVGIFSYFKPFKTPLLYSRTPVNILLFSIYIFFKNYIDLIEFDIILLSSLC